MAERRAGRPNGAAWLVAGLLLAPWGGAAAAPDTEVTGSLGQPWANAPGVELPASANTHAFGSLLREIWPLARARGVTRATFEAAFAGVVPDPRIEELTHRQSEFVKPIWTYLDEVLSPARIARGQAAARRWSAALAAIEAGTGVDRSVVLGVWGMETNFGSFTGGKDVIRSLATLAAMRYRGTYFRDELVTALVILQQGHVRRADMKGSWAGAMGQTQFMPSSFMRYAVDFDRDGHKDIWTSVPDALASTANYLRRNGWKPGHGWGFEVQLPRRFGFHLAHASYARWAAAGVRRADGKPMPRSGEASLLLPAGAGGPAFLVTGNFEAIKRYNNSEAYALGVAQLGQRVLGGGPIIASWPRNAPPLGRSERVELQRRLGALGYQVGEPDGRLGSRTREAVRLFQVRTGMTPDGYASLRVLEALRETH